jgi:WD40 repeat protein
MDIEAEYISSGCNRCPKSLDWGGNQNQLAYAFSNSIAILSDKEPYQIRITLNRHSDQVNCVKWISNLNNSSFEFNEFISGSVDKTLVVWRGSNLEVIFKIQVK